MKFVGPKEAQAMLAAGGVTVVDVREPREWAGGHLPGAQLLPLDRVRSARREALPQGTVLFVCAMGGRSKTAAGIAEQLGLTDVYTLEGGTDEWARLGLPIEVPPAPVATPASPKSAEPESAEDAEASLPGLDAVIGTNLRELRTRRGLTLDATARLTGISRALLGQLELGTSPPSVSVVWKIARGFDVPFAALLSAPGTHTTAVLRRESAKRLISADGRFSSRALFPFGESNTVEFYELWLSGHGREEAEAHAPGTRENLVVTAGRLALTVGDRQYELSQGDAIVFSADVPHVYANPDHAECWMHLVMTYVDHAPPR